MVERWLPVVGFELHYEVSDLGRIRSIRNNHGNARQRLLKLSMTHDGYLRVALCKERHYTKKHVAHAVLEAFVGPRPAGMQACHGPRGQQCNELTNLRWDTPTANYADRAATGFMRGQKHHQCSISEETARKIKIASADRSRLARDIAREHGTTVHVVRNIRNGFSWSWL